MLPRLSLFVCRWCVMFAFIAGAVRAASDPRPVVGPGATKDEVIAAYGWPNGQSQSGTKEILSYAQGDVILENGRVERVNFSPNVPWQTPKPRPAPPTASTRKVPEAPVDFWLTSFDAAQAEAQRRHARILALFTGSDWSPASRQFHDEVEYHPDFVNAFAGDFVFLKLDYPRGAPVPAKISPENLALRDRYGVTTYPTLLLLSPSGDLLTRVDLGAGAPNQPFRERVSAAVRVAAQLPAVAQPGANASERAAPGTPRVPETPHSTEQGPVAPVDSPTAPAMLSASRLVFGALLVGAVLIAAVLWRVWRQPVRRGGATELQMADRIDAAAGGMPTVAEMNGWSREKLRAVTAALVEFDGYTVHPRAAADEIDLELKKRGDVKPRVLVVCAPGAAGVIGTKRLRELFACLAAEGIDNGWFVCPAGFSADGRDYAASHRISLVGSDGLHALMREVPPVSLPGVLARA